MDFGFILFIIFAAAIAFVYVLVSTKNELVPLHEATSNARANIISALKQRTDLINQLLAVAVRYEDHERNMHKMFRDEPARGRGQPNRTSNSAQQASVVISHLGERFPRLRANETYQQLMHELSRVETAVQAKFEAYNQQVARFNSARNSFPANLVVESFLNMDSAVYLDASQDHELLPTSFDRDALRLQFRDSKPQNPPQRKA